MRQVVLDTETTGLDPKQGHRIIEIAGVEMVNRRLTNNHFHVYINPEREIDAGALAVHGISSEFLADKPKFADIATEFLEFIHGAELIIHNAPFDIGFLNHELALLGAPNMARQCEGVKDTLKMARDMFPGKRNNLDALCDRFGINNAHRTLHGALLDAELLADVFLAMTRGQESLMMDQEPEPDSPEHSEQEIAPLELIEYAADQFVVISADDEEISKHEGLLDRLEKETRTTSVWRAERSLA